MSMACTLTVIITGTLSLFGYLPTYASIQEIPATIKPIVAFNTVSMYLVLAYVLLYSVITLIKALP